jgi:hypothetical protein
VLALQRGQRTVPPASGGRKGSPHSLHVNQDKPVQRMVYTDVLPLTPDEVGVVSASPGSIEVGSLRVGMPSPVQAVMVTNAGNAPLRVGDIRLEGDDAADFHKTADAASNKILNPGATAIVNVRFTPGKRARDRRA